MAIFPSRQKKHAELLANSPIGAFCNERSKDDPPMDQKNIRTYSGKNNDHLGIHVGAEIESSVLDALLVLDDQQQGLDGRQSRLVQCVIQATQPELKITTTICFTAWGIMRSHSVHGRQQKVGNRVLRIVQSSKKAGLVEDEHIRMDVLKVEIEKIVLDIDQGH